MNPTLTPRLALPATLAAVAFTLVTPTPARASTCTAYPTHVRPHAGTAAIPTNTRIWYAGQSLLHALDDDGRLLDCDTPPRLVDAAGDEVATTPRSLAFAYVLVPDAPLTLGASYTIEHNCLYDTIAFTGTIEDETTSFTVTAEADTLPPATPDIAVGETESTEFDNGFVGYHMEVEGEFEGILLVDIGQQTTLDPAALTGEISLASTNTDFVIGHACEPTWSDAQPGDSTTVAFASFDLAGNFSGWTEPEPVTVDEQGCQCRAGASRPPRGTLALLLLGLLGRRRRSAQSAR